MSRTVSLPPVRVEPTLLDRLQEIVDRSPASMSAHVRQAVIEYVERQRLQPTNPPASLPEKDGNGAKSGYGDA